MDAPIKFVGKFEQRAPSHQNAVDLFRGSWATDLGEVFHEITDTGPGRFFANDPRPRWAAEALGTNSRFDGMSVLELGPLEAAHTYQLEGLGADRILAIEANVEAFLKCLVVKEISGMTRASFVHGDFVEYLRGGGAKFDLIFCSGVLYHMADPIELIELIAQATDKVFVATHYYDEDHYPEPPRGSPRQREMHPRYPDAELFVHTRPDETGATFWGGNRNRAAWLRRSEIFRQFDRVGFTHQRVFQEMPDHENGAGIIFAASRRPLASPPA
jgi:SAM-dependent methyltransferase